MRTSIRRLRPIATLAAVAVIALALISWGVLGHRTVGLIASRHLDPKAKAVVQNLLGSETLEQVSTWADEIRSDPAYKNAAPWHYINLPLGLSRQQFDREVTSMTTPNVYEALLRMEHDLTAPNTTRDQKIVALKFIVHFVGDIHQPMHVSRAQDQGGNKIQVNYDNKGTNLHALWDTRLIEHEGLSDVQLADKIDHASPKQIQQWQSDPVLQWLWESYGIATQLYAEVDAMNNRTITDAYYQTHLPIIEDRIEKAGIRLAGLLNRLLAGDVLKGEMVAPAVAGARPAAGGPAKEISIQDVSAHMGETVRVCSQVYSTKDFGSMTLVNLGAEYPNQLLTVVLRGATKDLLTNKSGQQVCVTGRLEMYKGKPEIVVTDKSSVSQQ